MRSGNRVHARTDSGSIAGPQILSSWLRPTRGVGRGAAGLPGPSSLETTPILRPSQLLGAAPFDTIPTRKSRPSGFLNSTRSAACRGFAGPARPEAPVPAQDAVSEARVGVHRPNTAG